MLVGVRGMGARRPNEGQVMSPLTKGWKNVENKKALPDECLFTRQKSMLAANVKMALPLLSLKTVPRGKERRRPWQPTRCQTAMISSSITANLARSSDLMDVLMVPSSSCQRTTLGTIPPLNLIKDISFLALRKIPFDYKDITMERVLRSETVQLSVSKAIMESTASMESTSEERRGHLRRGMQIFSEMKSAVSVLLLRVASVVVQRFFSKTLSGIHVNKEQMEMLRNVKATYGDVPIIYLPLHRSHLDYILLTFVLWLNDLRVPLVAAGDNLNIPFFGSLLRGLGGFFIRRKIDLPDGTKDFVYRGVLQQYLCEVLGQGHHLEFYLEGGRSRTGKSLSPKGGILSVIIHSMYSGHLKDAVIVPLAISYDKIIEGNFVSEQSGTPKRPESFLNAVKSIWKLLNSHFGSIRLEVAQPFSLKEFVQEKRMELNSESPVLPGGGGTWSSQKDILHPSSSSSSLICTSSEDAEEQSRITSQLADHVVFNATQTLVLTAPNLVAFLLLNRFRNGCREDELVSSLSELWHELESRGRKVTFSPSPQVPHFNYLIQYSVGLLSDQLVSVEVDKFYRGNLSYPSVFELQYYSNSVTEAFAVEGVIATAILSLTGPLESGHQHSADGVSVKRSEVDRLVGELCNILQFEFMQLSRANVFEDAWRRMVQGGLIHIQQSGTVVKRPAMEIDCDDAEREPIIHDEEIWVSTDPVSVDKLATLRFLTSSYLETYCFVAASLATIEEPIGERELIKKLVAAAKLKLDRGTLQFPESAASDSMQNAIKLLKKMKVLNTLKGDSGKVPLLGKPTIENLEAALNHLEQFKP